MNINMKQNDDATITIHRFSLDECLNLVYMFAPRDNTSMFYGFNKITLWKDREYKTKNSEHRLVMDVNRITHNPSISFKLFSERTNDYEEVEKILRKAKELGWVYYVKTRKNGRVIEIKEGEE